MTIEQLKADRANRYLGSTRKPSVLAQILLGAVLFALFLAAAYGDSVSIHAGLLH